MGKLTDILYKYVHPEHIPSDNHSTVIYYFWIAGQANVNANMSRQTVYIQSDRLTVLFLSV